ncbi:response regulator transcription factor [Marivirga sp. S37H4]|uniref:Response regulator transcription factor n=1 Tax=Marivirga aurantiaca TaxID=2802615 RepID=A0A934WYJ2_9BACT|nr:response regulator transcription factor [Marivirga aurantiaca]MBK6265538.1 response regulator transcription factor [Marivirga aurantiaca]
MSNHIFLVEDDESLAYILKDSLENGGYKVSNFYDGKSARLAFSRGAYHLCIIDVMLPLLDGFSLASYIRQMDRSVPILFLTARDAEEDKINGFKLGADDYITKPFSLEELKLRIEVFLRRTSQTSQCLIGKFKFDYTNLKLECSETQFILTQKEADLLKFLCMHADVVVKRETILKELWGDDDYFMGRSLDVFISKLRKYLSSDSSIEIKNYHGVGFKLLM